MIYSFAIVGFFIYGSKFFDDTSIYKFSKANGNFVSTLGNHNDTVTLVVSDDRYVYSASEDMTIK